MTTINNNLRVVLVSMVRNEEKIISRMMASVADHVAAMVFFDTGSTDSTIDVIKSSARDGVPVFIESGEFVDFSTSRNRAIEICKNFCKSSEYDLDKTWLLLLDADHVLETFGVELDAESIDDSVSVIKLTQVGSSLIYNNTRMVRASSDAHYVGRTHEYVSHSGGSEKIHTWRVYDHGDGGCKGDKFERDARLLLLDWKDNQNPRTAFYLAQTYWCLRMFDEAAKWYEKRISMKSDFEEETWYSTLGLAMCATESNKMFSAESILKASFFRRPWRAEPLFFLSENYLKTGNHRLAYEMASIGAGLKIPDDSLFVDMYIHKWGFLKNISISSFYCNKHKEGRIACDALRISIGTPHADLALKNYVFYAEKIKSSITNVPFVPEAGWSACNPSALKTDNGYAICVRTVNYIILQGHVYSTPENDCVRTKSFLLTTDRDLSPLGCVELKNPHGFESSVVGIEDVRIYSIKDGIVRGFGTRCDWNDRKSGPWSVPRVYNCSWSIESGEILNCAHMDVSSRSIFEKNWLPFYFKGRLLAIYSHSPFTIIDVELTQKYFVKNCDTFNLSGFKGSASPVAWNGGWLYAVHETVQRIDNGVRKFYYFHRVCWMNEDFELKSFSRPFYFVESGVEFCSGLSICEDGVEFYLGVNDNRAVISKVKTDDIVEMLSNYSI